MSSEALNWSQYAQQEDLVPPNTEGQWRSRSQNLLSLPGGKPMEDAKQGPSISEPRAQPQDLMLEARHNAFFQGSQALFS